MPRQQRHKTGHPGVYFVQGVHPATGMPERVFYICYRRKGRQIEEKAGRQYKDGMTAAAAALLRARRIQDADRPGDDRTSAPEDEAPDAGSPSSLLAAFAKRLTPAFLSGRTSPPGATVGRLWDAYAAHRGDYPGHTSDRGRFANHLAPRFAARETGSLTQADIAAVSTAMLQTHSAQTVRHTLSLLSRLVRFGVKQGLCAPLPFNLEMPAPGGGGTIELSGEQTKSLLDAIDAELPNPAAALMLLALYTGMRRGELYRLRWEDVDAKDGFCHVRDGNDVRRRRLPLCDPVLAALDALPRGGVYVFSGRGGKRRTDMRTGLARIVRLAGLPAGFAPLSGLRRVYARTLDLSGEADARSLQALLGLKTEAATRRYLALPCTEPFRAALAAARSIDALTAARSQG